MVTNDRVAELANELLDIERRINVLLDKIKDALKEGAVVDQEKAKIESGEKRRRVVLHQDGSILEIVEQPDDVDVVHFYKDALEDGCCPFCGDEIEMYDENDNEIFKCPTCGEDWKDLI